VRIAPRTHAGTWDPPGLAGALAGVLGAVHAAVGPVAVNLVVHAWPGGHHHAHVFPRLGEITVYDLGWGVPVCLIDTDEWAARLRGER
jgi:hypothetical protein